MGGRGHDGPRGYHTEFHREAEGALHRFWESRKMPSWFRPSTTQDGRLYGRVPLLGNVDDPVLQEIYLRKLKVRLWVKDHLQPVHLALAG